MDAAFPVASPLSADRLRRLAAEARPLLPVPRYERKDLLVDEAAALVDRLLVQVARGSGALAVAMGECLAALMSGAGPMRLGYSGIGDYARENLSMAGPDRLRAGQALAGAAVQAAAPGSRARGRGLPQEGRGGAAAGGG